MFSTFLALTFLFLMFMWSLAWVNYYNKLDKRFGSSLWRWSYDHPVPGDREELIAYRKTKIKISTNKRSENKRTSRGARCRNTRRRR